MEPQQCSNCRFYTALDDNAGLCRRHPPQGVIGPANRFPETLPTDWCGEYSPTVAQQADVRTERQSLRIISAILIPSPSANAPAHLACAVSLPASEQMPENCHLRADCWREDGIAYGEQHYGGPASSPACISIPPPPDGHPRFVQAVAYARDRDSYRTLAASSPVKVCWPAAE